MRKEAEGLAATQHCSPPPPRAERLEERIKGFDDQRNTTVVISSPTACVKGPGESGENQSAEEGAVGPRGPAS